MHCVNSHLNNQRKLLDDSIRDIKNPSKDFTSMYFAVGYLQGIAEKDPEIITIEAIVTLQRLLRDRRYEKERRGFFLFRLAADTLKAIIENSNGSPAGAEAQKALMSTLEDTTGYAHRVSAEALGALPLEIESPENIALAQGHIPHLQWSALKEITRIEITSVSLVGRSLVAELVSEKNLLVLKFARPEDTPGALLNEALWMDHIRNMTGTLTCRFNIPKPIEIHGNYLFKLVDPPFQALENSDLHREMYAISFLAHKDYFRYPNHSIEGTHLETEKISGSNGAQCLDPWVAYIFGCDPHGSHSPFPQ